ncbi:WD repeat-containing protein 36 [Toxorhynchites rutilus septentrionalis]|uniref:WD repeat-containing protein 36 n=1 Tax=Toxorhynchites rutilus septentrionalis TaxID=329112 RepID=UPI0024793714|nr:WD repeat-containing protein 36 [Toxorhynchites rutilus septentrionalis]
MRGSVIFQQNRALGYVSNHVPAFVRYIEKRNENVITTCIGKSFHVYGANSFRLIRVGGLHSEEISCVAADGFLTYVASGNVIYGWRNSTELRKTYRGHQKKVHLLLPFGKHLLSVDEDSLLKIWFVGLEEVYLEIPFNNKQFEISVLMHPASYKNKILLGSSQGGLQLWNIKNAKLVHTFRDFESKITVLEQAPAIDVAAIGLQNGQIILLNLKYEESIMKVTQDWGPVTGITFRTDGHPIMATSSINGQVTFWNLEDQVIVSTLLAHDDSVTSLKCFPSEPLLLTTSPDNSMKLWIFDLPDGGARLLRIREGHGAPPTCIRYHGAMGRNILSAGEDSSLRIFSTVSETLNKSLGKASYNRKASKKQRKREDPFRMPPISSFTSEITRDKEWDSIVAAHAGLVQVTTWSFDKCRMGELKMVPEVFQNKNRSDFGVTVSALCMSHCGNFVVVGYSSGHLERFNVQSGIHRASYGKSSAHEGAAVRGISLDNLNQFVVSGGSEGKIRWWHFKQTVDKPVFSLQLESISLFSTHRESAMIAVAIEDFSVVIVDSDSRAVVRKFIGHKGSITDACFSPDSRWLLTASRDCTIKIWDIPSAYMIDHFRMPQICTSLSMSPTGDFLATAYVDNRGIYLWANKTLYSHVSIRAIKPDAEAPLMDLPATIYDENSPTLMDESQMEIDDLEDAMEAINLNYESPSQLSRELITMSNTAASRWQNLLHLDIIKRRNRPKQAPQKPKSAPFFLPTVSGLDFQFNLDESNAEKQNDASSRIVNPSQVEQLTSFGKLLKKCAAGDDVQEYSEPIECLKKLGPSLVDYEIRNLSPLDEGTGSISVMAAFMHMIEAMLERNQAFELGQSWLAVFLKNHGRTIVENEELRTLLSRVEQAQSRGWNLLEDQLLYGIGVVSSLKNFNG